MEYMKIEGQFPKFSNCAVTLGKFDGIHRGHRKLIQKIQDHKKEYGTHRWLLPLCPIVRQSSQEKKEDCFLKIWEWMSFWNVR